MPQARYPALIGQIVPIAQIDAEVCRERGECVWLHRPELREVHLPRRQAEPPGEPRARNALARSNECYHHRVRDVAGDAGRAAPDRGSLSPGDPAARAAWKLVLAGAVDV